MEKICTLLLVFSMVLSMFLLSWPLTANVQHVSFAQGIPTIYLQPTENTFYTNQTLVGDHFNMTVWVRDAPPIGVWQLYMGFDDSMINVTRWIEPTTDPQYIFYGKTTQALPTPPNVVYIHKGVSNGSVKVMSNLSPAPPEQQPGDGNGTLCVFEFEIKRCPTNGTISSLLHIDTTDTYLLDPDGNLVNSVNKQDGSFNYISGTAPKLRLVESPQFLQFTPYQNVAGSLFNTTVSVNGPASVANLVNVSFTLGYDSSLFSTSGSDIIFNSIWTEPHNVSIETGRVSVTVSNSSPLPSEPAVAICTIVFTIQGQQTVPPNTLGDYIYSEINFTSSTLLNSDGNTIDQVSPFNQTIRIYAYQTETAVLEITQPTILSTSATIQKNTLFAINVSVTDVYNPSLIQVELLYNQSIIFYPEVALVGEVTSDYLDSDLSQPGLAVTNVSISGHAKPTVSGPIFQFRFRAVTENATSYLNFSQPYGQDTFIQDSAGAIVSATYLETSVHVSETPRAQLVIGSSQNHLDALVKEQCSFEITVKNEGNVEASNISLSLSGVPSQWLQFPEDKFSLVPNSNETLLVTVSPTYTGEFNLTIVATSAEGDTATAKVTLTVTESTTNPPPWELIILAMTIGIGAVTAFLIVRSRRRKKTRLVRR